MPLPAELLRRYNVPGPRYTSYPTVAQWDTTPDLSQWRDHVGRTLAGDIDQAGIALYVHVPFCQSLCTFCGCNIRIARNHAVADPYVDTLLAEQQLYRAQASRPWRIGQLYLGGGTPTFLLPGTLDRLLDGLLQDADVLHTASLCAEVDPRVTTRAHLEVLRRHGFDSLSLGVQDMDARVLDIVNRSQSEGQIRAVNDTARALGFTHIAFDLIYGLPLQTADSIRLTMDTVARLKPDQIAFYAYAPVPWLKPSQRQFTDADLPDAEARLKLHLQGRERLDQMGYEEIGFDQYVLPHTRLARAARDKTLHRNFMGYTAVRSALLLGLGVSAMSDVVSACAQNDKNPLRYETRVLAGDLAIQRGHVLTATELKTAGHIRDLVSRYETSAPEAATQPAMLQLQQDGLIRIEGARIEVLAMGRAFLRNICMAFDAHAHRTGLVGHHAS
jgi:oxygen-independent coproporphyrinogen III oxidase